MDASDAARHDLLFGLLALQNGLIDQVQLVAAFQAWTCDKVKSLAEHLEARRDLDPDDRRMIEALVARHLKKHGGDAEKSLAALAVGPSTRESLARVVDPLIEASLAQVAFGSNADGDRTMIYDVTTATSDSQRFRKLRPHAKGGLGAVFVALDDELHREVALKQILEAHAHDPVSRQRFLLEAEITGGLEHPGIVPVYGLGTYSDGRPYYAMRFIRGDSLKEAIVSFHANESLKRDAGQRSLELRKLLRRFTDVCNAIDYAHGRGVLHRDIKPGNIIVGRYGETLVVDWGLAKATGKADPISGERTLAPRSASGSAATFAGSALGTPGYMSPEQASGDLDHLGPASDVYSLGATLYCLLTGKPPFEGDDLGGILQNVQKGSFPRPQSLDATIDPALEAVCLKAMALKPEDRYGSCKAVAEDIERWMADEPVIVWHEPFLRRARRWGRHHRTLVTGVAAALVVAVLGMSALIFVQAQANEAERRSKTLVAAQFELALNAVKAYYQGVTGDFLLAEPAMASVKQMLLQSPQKFFRELKTQLENSDQRDPETRKKLADACTDLGRISEKIGNAEDTIEAYQQAITILESLAREQPRESVDRVPLASNYIRVGYSESLRGRNDLAENAFRTALAMLEQAVKLRPGNAGALFQLANAQNFMAILDQTRGRFGSAETSFLAALETRRSLESLFPTNIDYREGIAWNFNSLGLLYRAISKPAKAAEQYRAAMKIQEDLIRQYPHEVKYRLSLSHHYNNLAIVHTDLGEFDAAIQAYREAIRIDLDLFHKQPAVAKFRNDSGVAYTNLGGLFNDLRRYSEAEQELGSALEILEPLAREYPDIGEYQNDLASVQNNLGLLYERTNRLDRAETAQAAAVKIRKELCQRFPDVPGYRIKLAGSVLNLADLARTTDAYARALETCADGIEILSEVLRVAPNDATAREYLGNGFWSQAEILGHLDRLPEALAAWDRAIELAGNDRVRANMLTRRALMKIRLGQVEQAIADAEALVRPDRSADGDGVYNVACVFSRAAEAISAQTQGEAVERTRRADALAEKAMTLLKRLVSQDFFENAANFSNLQADPDLAVLKPRADFKELISELQNKKK